MDMVPGITLREYAAVHFACQILHNKALYFMQREQRGGFVYEPPEPTIEELAVKMAIDLEEELQK